MDTKKLDDISEKMVERYSNRYNKLGYDVRTLGWGSVADQTYRFSQILSGSVSWENKSVLDIGCGFGDLGNFFLKNNGNNTGFPGYN